MTPLEFHEIANALPLLQGEEFKALIEDVRMQGLQMPITLYEGKILDGRNRYRACIEAGIKPEFIEFNGGNPWRFVWSLNGQRRHFQSQEQKYLCYISLENGAKEFERIAKDVQAEANRKRSETQKGIPKEEIKQRVATSSGETLRDYKAEQETKGSTAKAAAAEVNRGAVERMDNLQKNRPDLAEKVKSGKLKAGAAIKQMQRDQRDQDLQKAMQDIDPVESIDIRHCSMDELFDTDIAPDAVICDPPYEREYLPLYYGLALRCAQKNIKLVAVMTGQSHLPHIYSAMSESLMYRWTMAYFMPGGQAVQQFPAKINTFWKPILLYGEADDWLGDVCRSQENDKRFHQWGQSESGMIDLVTRLTKPGQLVCDPFLGAGTTAIACLLTGRRFVGCDIDAKHVETAKGRCAMLIKQNQQAS